jgi:enoyl-CoA hydratase
MTGVSTTMAGDIATIGIDCPPVNALGPDSWVKLRDVLESTSADLGVRVVILTGGPGRFCAGADIRTLTEPTDEPALMLRLVADVAEALKEHRVPVIAAIDGPTHGGGLELALACDLRVASPTSTFAASGVNMGLIASVRSLVASVGETRARTMLLTGEGVDATTAEAWGLVTHLDPNPEVLAAKLATTIASKAPHAIESTKVALGALSSLNTAEHDALVTGLFTTLVGTEDHTEAVNAFLSKRNARFSRD